VSRRCASFVLSAVVLLSGCSSDATGEPSYRAERVALVAEIEREVAELRPQLGFDRLDRDVVEALLRTPRHEFVPAAVRDAAYDNHPLPIGHGQTISQPLIVALMSHLLQVDAGDRVYELGTGSGYQAAVLAEMGVEVYSIEIVSELADRAARDLARLGYVKAHVRAGDGYVGWPSAAPFDAVIVTAAVERVPPALVEQLVDGGRLVMPIGALHGIQQLAVFVKGEGGRLERRDVLSVQFVPLTGEHGVPR
jgi:protein-L-isoaspartate(D-aspartate) O-methyltransferase